MANEATAATEATRSSTGKLISVKYGPMESQYPYAGLTVSQIREKIKGVLDIDKDAVAKNGKTDLAEDHVMQPNDQLTFHKKLGEKGL